MALVVYLSAGTAVQSVVDFKHIMTTCREQMIITHCIILNKAVKTDVTLLS
jgi:hypothetical protein